MIGECASRLKPLTVSNGVVAIMPNLVVPMMLLIEPVLRYAYVVGIGLVIVR